MTRFERVPMTANLGLALCAMAYATVAERYWLPDLERFKALVEHWTPLLQEGQYWPSEVNSARQALDAAYHTAFHKVLLPVSTYIMSREVVALREATP